MASRILMISTNNEVLPQPVVPIGAAWVAEALHSAGFDVAFLDLCFEKDPLKRVRDAVQKHSPAGIGISLRNLDNCDFLSPRSYLPPVKQLVRHIKSLTDAPILLGGAGVSIMPKEVLGYLDLDHAVAGEGESAAVSFFSSNTQERETVPGIVSRISRSAAEISRIQPCDGFRPRTGRWVQMGKYLSLEPVIPVQGKRGCANNCLYCTYGRVEGKEWRPREPGEVAEEMLQLAADHKAAEFEFVDSVFNQPEGYAEELLEELIRRRINARLHISSLSPAGISGSFARLMEKAGVVSAVITPESASDDVLQALGKGFTREAINMAAEVMAGTKIMPLWCFMVGGPNERERTLSETIRFMNRIVGSDHLFVATGIRIYPGTGLYQTAIAEGIVPAGKSLLMPSFYFSPLLSPKRAMEMLRRQIGSPGRCIFLSDTGLGAVTTFRRIGTRLRLQTPFWRYSCLVKPLVSIGKRISDGRAMVS